MIENVVTFTFPAAFALLPGVMDTLEARAMLVAIGLQESGFRYRRQIGGPARGFYMFEQAGGTAGVLTHESSKLHAQHVCAELLYPPDAETCYRALADNDVLACCFARLLLWTLPDRLAPRGHTDQGWRQYTEGWRPGTPRRETWNEYFAQAWTHVDGGDVRLA